MNAIFLFHCYFSWRVKSQLPGHLQLRLQSCVDGFILNANSGADVPPDNQQLEGWLLRWLQKLQFKMGQIEIQSSTASQFYNV